MESTTYKNSMEAKANHYKTHIAPLFKDGIPEVINIKKTYMNKVARYTGMLHLNKEAEMYCEDPERPNSGTRIRVEYFKSFPQYFNVIETV